MTSLPHDDSRTDAELLVAYNRGELAAFDVLYLRYRDWVVRVAHRFTGHADDALDVLQEAFAYLLRKAPDLRLTARMTTLLYPVVKHLSLAARRKRGRFQSDEDALAGLAAASNPGQAASGELFEMVRSLSEVQREVLLLRFVDDLSLQEIAEALSIPLGTVKSRLNHALAALRASPIARRYFDR
jgi:RNA polymerase sigma-70 factor (ECF subfamily)